MLVSAIRLVHSCLTGRSSQLLAMGGAVMPGTLVIELTAVIKPYRFWKSTIKPKSSSIFKNLAYKCGNINKHILRVNAKTKFSIIFMLYGIFVIIITYCQYILGLKVGCVLFCFYNSFIIPISHTYPWKPTGHAHVNPMTSSSLRKHVPPFRHGVWSHGFASEIVNNLSARFVFYMF